MTDRKPTDQKPSAAELIQQIKEQQKNTPENWAARYLDAGISIYCYGHQKTEDGTFKLDKDGKWIIQPAFPWRKYLTAGYGNGPPLELIEKHLHWAPNIAIICGPVSNLTVVDCDTDASVEFVETYLTPDELDSIPQAVGSKGRHFYFQHEPELGFKPRREGEILIDCPASVFCPPSLNRSSKEPYRWITADITKLPAPKMSGLLKEKLLELSIDTNSGGKKFDARQKWKKLEKNSHQRNHILCASAGHEFANGADLQTVLERARKWNASLPDPLDDEQVETTVNSLFEKDNEKRQQADTEMARLNEKYLYYASEAKSLIFKENKRGLQTCFRSYTKEPFETNLSNRIVHVNGKPVGAGTLWLKSPQRRDIQELIFDPKLPPGYYIEPERQIPCLNLWAGPAVKPVQNDELYENILDEFLLEIICNGDQEIFEYLLCWMARVIQQPGEPGGTAIALIGGQAIGKSTFLELFNMMLGRTHCFITADRNEVIGHFNSQIMNKIIIGLEEATFPGDNKMAAKFKHLITSSSLNICEKYKPIIAVPNVAHFVFTSNEPWIVPVHSSERRYLPLAVSHRRQVLHEDRGSKRYEKNRRWWSDFYRMLHRGGIEALLDGLLHHDLSGFHPMPCPVTDEYYQQKRFSQGGILDWFNEFWQQDTVPQQYCLNVDGAADQYGYIDSAEGVIIATAYVYGSYTKYHADHRLREPKKSCHDTLGRWLADHGVHRKQVTGGKRGWLFRRDKIELALKTGYRGQTRVAVPS